MGSHICTDCGDTFAASPGGFEEHLWSPRHARALEKKSADQPSPLQAAVDRAIEILERPHKHDWRPDLVTCGVEQDALSILLEASGR